MSQSIYHDPDLDHFYFKCPHCELLCQVPRSEIRCTVFRHAVFKKSGEFVPPHAEKEECERWIREDLVWGCAKPFRFNGKMVEVCGYV